MRTSNRRRLKMRKELVDQLVCPITREPLTLEITLEDEHGEVIEGALFSERINFRYPIEDGIPNLLPPDLQRRPDDSV